jgi:hypothetical protein
VINDETKIADNCREMVKKNTLAGKKKEGERTMDAF